MTDYERIAKVIRYLDANHDEQPDLETLAQQIGLSPSRFHRLFTQWAGITPKEFLQCLTMTHAKQSLNEGRNVLDTSLASGLSGPGRLHDLCVKLEAASPGEIKSGGEGLTLVAGYAETPFGKSLIAETPRGICHLSFVDCRAEMVGDLSAAAGRSSTMPALQKDWWNAEIVRDDKRAEELAEKIFLRTAGTPSLPPLKLFVNGTPFQVKVWQALLQIPEGKLVSYGDLAAYIGNPKASRAVGTAVGKNPIAYLIPCHRVIRETGAIGGYRWGILRKKAILGTEGSKTA